MIGNLFILVVAIVVVALTLATVSSRPPAPTYRHRDGIDWRYAGGLALEAAFVLFCFAVIVLAASAVVPEPIR